MTTGADFTNALSRGLVLDGAMGTELTRIGRKIGAGDWVASTLGDAGDVSAIHRAYAEAGAQVHTANTFATARHVLAAVGLEDRFEEINRDLVHVCREAVASVSDRRFWVGGSISTYVIGSDRANLPQGAALHDNIAEQATLLADAGCNLILLEMLFDVDVTGQFIAAAAESGLPLAVGLTCGRLEDGRICLAGAFRDRPKERIPLEDAAPAIVAALPKDRTVILSAMHSDLDVTDEALTILARHWTGPLGVYPNSGRLAPPDDWDHDSVCDTTTFLRHTAGWKASGAKLIGGCCGVGPAHIAALVDD